MARLIAAACWMVLLCGTLCAQSPWAGEWGEFHAAGAHVWKGSGITISECSSSLCAFAIRVNQDGNGSASGSLSLSSANEAVAHLSAFGQEHCSLGVSLLGDGKAIQVSALRGDCGYFQTSGATFVGTYPLHSHTVFASERKDECFAATQPAELAICNDKRLADALKSWEMLFDQVQDLTESRAGVSALASENAAKDELLRNCASASPAGPCLQKSIDASTAKLTGERETWLQSVTEPGDAAEANRKSAAIRGGYQRRFRNGDVQGNGFFSTDRLRISPLSDGRIQYSLELNFFNGHECSLTGTAQWTVAGAFVDRKPNASAQPTKDPLSATCFFELRPTQSGLTLADPTGACREMSCGARGGYNGAGFTFRERSTPHLPAKAASKKIANK